MEYMVLRFSDNDFGTVVELMLNILVDNIDRKNLGPNLEAMHSRGELKGVLLQGIHGAYVARRSATAVRMNSIDYADPKDFNLATYLSGMEIHFFKSASDFNTRAGWDNGENAYLNLRTGDVSTF